jgi:hypothetical protein
MLGDGKKGVYILPVLLLLIFQGISFAQGPQVEKSDWLLGVISKLERMRETAIEDIRKYEAEIQKCDNTIGKSENILKLARQQGNVKVEEIAREALANSQKARATNAEMKGSAELNRKRAENALTCAKTGGKDLESTVEQVEFENINAAWMDIQWKLIRQRLEEPNKWCGAISASFVTKEPPLPYKKFNELQPGDVLLFEGKAIAMGDNLLSSGDNASSASHTVSYLKEVNGRKLFLDNQPLEGPRIISENELLKRYGQRGAEVAKLAQPLNEEEAKRLYAAAAEMAQKNRKETEKNWFGTPWLGTNYGAWGKDDLVCSEADWALLNSAGRKIPKSGDRIKAGLGIDFSPADYQNSQYFLVTPLEVPKYSSEEK